MEDTRRTLVAWNAAPGRVVARWLAGAAVVTALLLVGVLVVAASTSPDPTHLLLPGLNRPAGVADVARVVGRNLLVLTLHAMACVAGFIAGSSLPLQAEHHAGLWRRVHLAAGPAAIVFVVAATGFSLLTQAYVLGGDAAILAAQLHVSTAVLLLTLLPHAVPELLALFLPLAAWIIASRRDAWEELLAATFATTALALPVLAVAANVEVFVWPHLLRLASPVA